MPLILEVVGMSPGRGGGQGLCTCSKHPSKIRGPARDSDSTLGKLIPEEFRDAWTVTFPLVTTHSHSDQRTGRIHARHHAYHCSRQVRPLRGPRSEVSSQFLRLLAPLQPTRHESLH